MNQTDLNKVKLKKLSLIRKEIKNESFLKSLFKSERFKELYNSKEAKWSLSITFILTIFSLYLYQNNAEQFLEDIQPLILTFIGGFISLIAFSLTALALTIASISKDNFVNILELDKNCELNEISKQLVEKTIITLYRFYFSAGFNLISVIILTIGYFYYDIPLLYDIHFNFLLGFLFIYIINFSLVYTLTLFSTCIKLTFYF